VPAYHRGMANQDQIHDARRLLVLTGRIGSIASEAIANAVGHELTDNGPVVALLALDEQGSLRPSALQELTGLSSGGVSKLLDRLQESGLVSREYGVLPQDRRASIVRLTAKGRRTAHRMAEAIVAQADELRVMLKEIQAFLEDGH
jgi:DNA-binding MarR family transcriptional regulator